MFCFCDLGLRSIHKFPTSYLTTSYREKVWGLGCQSHEARSPTQRDRSDSAISSPHIHPPYTRCFRNKWSITTSWCVSPLLVANTPWNKMRLLLEFVDTTSFIRSRQAQTLMKSSSLEIMRRLVFITIPSELFAHDAYANIMTNSKGKPVTHAFWGLSETEQVTGSRN